MLAYQKIVGFKPLASENPNSTGFRCYNNANTMAVAGILSRLPCTAAALPLGALALHNGRATALAARWAPARCARSMTTAPPLCNERLYYELLNIIQPSIDEHVHVRRRLHCYNRTFTLVKLNQRSSVKADNLHVLLYSRYNTTRLMLGGAARDDDDDELLKQKFKALTDGDWGTRQEFENAYNAVIEGLQPAGAAAPYIALTNRFFASCSASVPASAHDGVAVSAAAVTAAAAGEMAPPAAVGGASAAASTPTPLSDAELGRFSMASTMPGDVMVEKLEQDVAKFMTRKQRILKYLHDFEFVNGWITAAGISLLWLQAAAHLCQ